jgi:YVTN family beta-propeller protein
MYLHTITSRPSLKSGLMAASSSKLLRRLLHAWVLAVGLLALASAAAHAQSQTYVTNSDDDTLSLIYTATHEIKNPPVRAIIPLRPAGDYRKYNPVATAVTPYRVEGNANGQFVYTTNKDVDSVSVVDTAKSKLVGSPIPIVCPPGSPAGCKTAPVAVATSGVRLNPVGGGCDPRNPLWRTFAYVANYASGTLSIIDSDPNSATFNTVVKTLKVGNGPTSVAIAKPTLEQVPEPGNGMFFTAGFYVVVTNSLDSTVSVIDADPSRSGNLCDKSGPPNGATFHTVVRTLDLSQATPAGRTPKAVAFDRFARWAYVVNAGSNNVTAIDTCPSSPTSQGACGPTNPPNHAPQYHTVTKSIPVGRNPSGIAITIDYTGTAKHKQFRAYVPNTDDDSFSVIDVEAGYTIRPNPTAPPNPNFQTEVFRCRPTDVACLKPGDKPTGVSVMYPDEDFVYITNYGSNTVSVIDSDPDSLGGPGGVIQYNHEVGRIKRGIGSYCPAPAPANAWCGHPVGITNTPRIPYAYVMNSGSKSISVVGASPQIGDPHPILETIQLGFNPYWVTLNRNQDFIFITDPAGGKVHVLNTLAQMEVGYTTENIGTPARIATPPDGWSAYVTSTDNSVYAVDTVDRSGPGGPGDPFVPGGDDDVTYLIPGAPNFAAKPVRLRKCSTGDPLTGDPTDGKGCTPRNDATQSSRIANVGRTLGGLDVHPDNFEGYVSSKDTDQVVIIDTHYDRTTWNMVLGTIQLPTGSGPVAVGFTHRGGRALVMNSNNTVTVLDTLTKAILKTIPVGTAPMAVAFNEGDQHAYVTNSGDGTVSVIDLRPTIGVQPNPAYLTVVAPHRSSPLLPFDGRRTVKVGDNPQDVFINLGERVAAYVVNKGSNSISIIDDQPYNDTFNSVLDTIKVGTAPVGIILTEP